MRQMDVKGGKGGQREAERHQEGKKYVAGEERDVKKHKVRQREAKSGKGRQSEAKRGKRRQREAKGGRDWPTEKKEY